MRMAFLMSVIWEETTQIQKVGHFFALYDSPFKVEYKRDIENFTELRREKYMSHSSFDPKPCTHRTYEFYEKLHNLGAEIIFDVNGNQRKIYELSVPNCPKETLYEFLSFLNFLPLVKSMIK